MTRNPAEKMVQLAIQIVEAAGLAVVPPGDSRLFEGTLAEMEARAIRLAVLRCGGNRDAAAKMLGIGVRTLYRRVKQLGLEKRTS